MSVGIRGNSYSGWSERKRKRKRERERERERERKRVVWVGNTLRACQSSTSRVCSSVGRKLYASWRMAAGLSLSSQLVCLCLSAAAAAAGLDFG